MTMTLHETNDGSHDEHVWVVRTNDHGDPYDVCLGCGKQGHWEPIPGGDLT
jgi:hypothetical protein